jgi:hypothetical protein
MPMHIAAHAGYVVACIIFLYMKIFVCFIKQAWGGDDSILWLSFAQQKTSFLKLD